MMPPAPTDKNLFRTDEAELSGLKKLPESLEKAKEAALEDAFIRTSLPKKIREIYCSE